MRATDLLVAALAAVPLLAAADDAKRGAKDFFFDPTLEAASAPAKTSKPPARPPARLDDVGRRIASLPSNPADQKTLGLSYWIELVGPQGVGERVTDTRAFRSGEKIRLHFRSNADGYVSLVQMDSEGTSSLLFPSPAHGLTDNRIRANEDRILPAESAWFRFDDAVGTERLVVFFARTQGELGAFPVQRQMDRQQTLALQRSIAERKGGKDLILEVEPARNAADTGSYGVSLTGKPVVMEVTLSHR